MTKIKNILKFISLVAVICFMIDCLKNKLGFKTLDDDLKMFGDD